jgi:PhzF family phenazine biosynthesis protein
LEAATAALTKGHQMTVPRTRTFAQVDVFSTQPFRGNPVAVVLDGTGLAEQDMQALARWTNLSETTFVLPPTTQEADYRLRIFTPGGELPFAGHPTLGSARAWLDAGCTPRHTGRIIQECGAGLVTVRREKDALAFAAPPRIRDGALDEAYLNRLIDAFGLTRAQVLDHQWVDNGPGWAVLRLATAREVLALEPDLSLIPDAMAGVIGAHPAGAGHDFEMRTFAPGADVPEDPACGSMNAAVGQWLTSTGAAPSSYWVSQGTRLGRAATIEVTAEADGTVWISGATTVAIRGRITL